MRRTVLFLSLLLAAAWPVAAQETAYAVRQCLSGCVGHDLLRYDAATGAAQSSIHLSTDPGGEISLTGTGQLAIAPDGRRAYVTFDARILFVDLVGGSIVHTITTVASPSSPWVSRGGQRLYVLNRASETSPQLMIINTVAGTVDTAIDISTLQSPSNLVMVPDESAAVVLTATGLAKITQGALPQTVTLSGLTDVDVSPDGTRIYALNSGGGLTVLDATTLGVVGTLTLTGQFGSTLSLAVSPDGARVYAGASGNTLTSGSVRVATTSPLAQEADLPGGATVRMAPTGTRLLAVGNGTGTSSVALLRLVATSGGATTSLGSFVTTEQRLNDLAMGPDLGCAIGALSPTSATAAFGGGSGSVLVPAGTGCAWTASSGSSWVTITSGGGSAGTGTVQYTVAANTAAAARQATLTIAGQSFVVTQAAHPLAGSPSALRYAARRAGPVTAPVFFSTAPQAVTVLAAGAPTLAWTATADQAWVTIAGGSGTGGGQFTVTVDPSPFMSVNGTFTSTITIAGPGGTPSATVPVTLVVYPEPVSAVPPVGLVDTPIQDATGVQGAIAMTGWVVDDVRVRYVKIYRSCLPSEIGGPGCYSPGGLRGLSYVVELGDATIVPGARPDVEALYPTHPASHTAGWGFMILSNMLPNVTAGTPHGGVGRIDLWAMAWGEASDVTVLGRTILDRDPTRVTLANDTIAKPFGAIDTPTQGATVSGTVNNFGWVLTPDPGTGVLVPLDGSTVTVFVDGAAVGTATYNLCRGSVAVNGVVPPGVLCDDDVSTAFRGNGTLFRNLDAGRGAIGLRSVSTTALTNGQHTLSWSVTDSANRSEGIGSRYITVLNGAADPCSAACAVRGAEQDFRTSELRNFGTSELRNLGTSIYARTGFDLQSAFTPLALDASGVPYVRIPELGRVELQIPGVVEAVQLVNGEVRSAPIGVGINRETGTVTWAPGPGFLGSYRLAFVVQGPGSKVQGPIVDVSVVPASATVDPVRMHLDRVDQVGAMVTVHGWSLDPGAASGAGIGAVHVWARRRVQGSEPVFLGAADLGIARPDVAAAHGVEFRDAGFVFTGVLPGDGEWEVTAYVWVMRTGRFEDARSVRVAVVITTLR